MLHENPYEYKLAASEKRYAFLDILSNGRYRPGGYLITWEIIDRYYIGTVGHYRGVGVSLEEAHQSLVKSYYDMPEIREEHYVHDDVTMAEEFGG